MTVPTSFVIVLTTFPADHDPAALSRILVEEHLAACVNVLPPMHSVYRWEGQIEQATEHQLIIKTTAGRVETLKQRLSDLHPYDVPEFLVLTVSDGAEAYLRWLSESA